jgi:SAM-dependent methyltransferase
MSLYDAVSYPGRPFEDTHPDRLAAIATLFGMQPALPARCRMLEVACGDGANLIPLAFALPDSAFTGIDLARLPIEQGQAWSATLGLRNVSLQAQDLTAFSAAPASFDYIIAHGLYSWVPQPVRDALMALIGRHLAPEGVAFVSYNIYPGCHVRRMLWDALKFHTEGIDDPHTRIEEATALARMIAGGRNDSELNPLQVEAAKLLERDSAYTFHDDLSPHNEPLYFHQFVEHAAAHGLQFLSESELGKAGIVGLSPQGRGALSAMDAVTREQYLDFLHCRRFRQTLLCRAEVTLTRPPRPDALDRLRLAAGGQVTMSSGAAAADDEPNRERRTLEDLLAALGEVRPRTMSLHELQAAVAARQGRAAPDADGFARLVLGAALNGAVQLHAMAPPLVTEAGERPVASALARAQSADTQLVTGLLHQSVRLDDPVARKLFALLDGTRDRTQLIAELGSDLGNDVEDRAAQLDAHLHSLGRLGLLSA